MKQFSYKEVYRENDKKIVEVNILTEKYCNFHCIFCPIRRSDNQVDGVQSFENHLNSLIEFNVNT